MVVVTRTYYCLQCFDAVGWVAGTRKGIRPVKTSGQVMARLSVCAARCRLAYGPADATATHCLLLQ